MPLFMADVMNKGQDIIGHDSVRVVFDNPFFSAAIATIFIILLIFVLVDNIAMMDLARFGIFTYFLMVVILFLNNKMLIEQIRSKEKLSGNSEGLDLEFLTPLHRSRVNPQTYGEDEEVLEDAPEVSAESTSVPLMAAALTDTLIPNMYPPSYLAA